MKHDMNMNTNMNMNMSTRGPRAEDRRDATRVREQSASERETGPGAVTCPAGVAVAAARGRPNVHDVRPMLVVRASRPAPFVKLLQYVANFASSADGARATRNARCGRWYAVQYGTVPYGGSRGGGRGGAGGGGAP